jgi:hypothetical protein
MAGPCGQKAISPGVITARASASRATVSGTSKRKAHPVYCDFVGICVAGAILGTDTNADAVADALAGVIDHRLFEREALGAAILEVEIGVVRFAFERAAEDSLERAVVHAKTVEEKFIGSNKFVRHYFCRL